MPQTNLLRRIAHSGSPLIGLLWFASPSTPAAVIEVIPGNLTPPQQPIRALSVQYFDTRASGRYAEGVSNGNESARARSARLSGYSFDRIGDTATVVMASTAYEKSEGRRIAPPLDQTATLRVEASRSGGINAIHRRSSGASRAANSATSHQRTIVAPTVRA